MVTFHDVVTVSDRGLAIAYLSFCDGSPVEVIGRCQWASVDRCAAGMRENTGYEEMVARDGSLMFVRHSVQS